MREKRIDTRSSGVLCIAGGYAPDQDEFDERGLAYGFATERYERFEFVRSTIVDLPSTILSCRDYHQFLHILKGVRLGVNREGYEKITFFGSRVTMFMLVVVAESRLRRKPLDFHASPGSSLERYGNWFSRHKQNAWEAYLQAEMMEINTAG